MNTTIVVESQNEYASPKQTQDGNNSKPNSGLRRNNAAIFNLHRIVLGNVENRTPPNVPDVIVQACWTVTNTPGVGLRELFHTPGQPVSSSTPLSPLGAQLKKEVEMHDAALTYEISPKSSTSSVEQLSLEEDCDGHDEMKMDGDVTFPIEAIVEAQAKGDRPFSAVRIIPPLSECLLKSAHSKLYRWDDITEEWVERGRGKIEVQKNEGKRFVLFRREGTHCLAANVALPKPSDLRALPHNDRAFCWIAADFSCGEPIIMILLFLFGSSEDAASFKAIVDGCAYDSRPKAAQDVENQDLPSQASFQSAASRRIRPSNRTGVLRCFSVAFTRLRNLKLSTRRNSYNFEKASENYQISKNVHHFDDFSSNY